MWVFRHTHTHTHNVTMLLCTQVRSQYSAYNKYITTLVQATSSNICVQPILMLLICAMLHVPQQRVLHTASLVEQEFWGYSCNLLWVIEMYVMVAFYTAHHYLQKALEGWEELHWLRMWCVSCLMWGHMTSNTCPGHTTTVDKSTLDFGQKSDWSKTAAWMHAYTNREHW